MSVREAPCLWPAKGSSTALVLLQSPMPTPRAALRSRRRRSSSDPKRIGEYAWRAKPREQRQHKGGHSSDSDSSNSNSYNKNSTSSNDSNNNSNTSNRRIPPPALALKPFDRKPALSPKP